MRRRPASAQAGTTRALRNQNRVTRELPRSQRTAPAQWPQREAVFSFYGALTPSVSPRWSHPDGAILTEAFAWLDTAGASPTTVVVLLNGTAVVTVTVPTGQHRATWSDADGVEVDRYDYLQAQIVLPGGGAESLTVQARFS